jgi:hypothetical protein
VEFIFRMCRLATVIPMRKGLLAIFAAGLFSFSSSAWAQSGAGACDVNKDGLINVVDVQIAVNNYLSCSLTTFQTFYPQVITGVLSSCPVTSGLHTVSLSWTASTTAGVTYNVYRAITAGGYNYATPLNSTPISGTSFTDCSVALSQTYFYVIVAVNGSGNTSVNSSASTVTIPAS